MRCPDCNKFVGNDEQEPEVNDVEVNSGSVTAEVRIVNACDQCGTELAETTFSMEANPKELADHDGEGHELEAEESGAERTSRQGYFKKGVFVSKGGRFGKTFYGASVTVSIKCSCGVEIPDVTLEDECQASGMDSMV